MKAVILAGGLGTRISEETHLKPKPMIEIGGKDKKDDWKITKTMCNTEDEVVVLIKEWNSKDLDN